MIPRSAQGHRGWASAACLALALLVGASLACRHQPTEAVAVAPESQATAASSVEGYCTVSHSSASACGAKVGRLSDSMASRIDLSSKWA